MSEPALKIGLFGCPTALHTRTGQFVPLGRPSRLLIACLLLQGRRPHRRELIADRLWPLATPESATRSFRTALWRLRRVLEPVGIEKGTYVVVSSNGEVGFNWESSFTADVLELETGVRAFEDDASTMPADRRIATLKAALDQYSGDLLEGSVEDWVIYERERLRRLYLRGLNALFRAMAEAGRPRTAIRYGRKILELDPVRESTHRRMLRLYAKSGQHEQSISLYRELVERLRSELGVAPTRATREVYEAVLRSRTDSPSDSSSDSPDGITDGRQPDLADQMRSCLDDCDAARVQLKDALSRLRNLLNQG